MIGFAIGINIGVERGKSINYSKFKEKERERYYELCADSFNAYIGKTFISLRFKNMDSVYYYHGIAVGYHTMQKQFIK